MTHIDAAIVGGGVAGLATALALAAEGHSVCVLESHPRPGMETSTHNSGVIHAGLYYPPGSLKARLCLEGRDALYAYCASRGVPHRRTGKLVVADDPARASELDAIAANARANGARAEVLDRRGIAARMEGVDAAAALWSPDTGIVDAASLVRALSADAQASGAAVLTGSPLTGAGMRGDGVELRTPHETIHARVVVNAAGLHADDVSTMLGGERFRIWACRGDYAELTRSASARFTMPLYPMPELSGHGLGVHFTPTIDGAVLLGPTARYQESKTDYESDRPPLTDFLESARRLFPGLALDDLRESGSGIRAKLHPANERFADFMIRADASQPRLIHAAGIDSPGLTSCLAIGRLASELAAERL